MASKIIKATCLGALLYSVLFYGYDAHTLSSPAVVRIALVQEADEFTLAIRGRYILINPQTNEILWEGRALKRTLVKVQDNGIAIGQTHYPYRQLRITPRQDVTIVAGGKDHRYRENIDIILDKDKKFLVVNVINLEQYIKGVLYHEVSHRWPLEAIKAQAVAVRTYALYQIKQNRDKPFDVTSDIYSQVYGGRSAERYRTTVAVNRTKGEVLTFNKEILPAYYSSNCAGHTEDVSELWDQNLVPLKGRVCPFCQGAPHSKWKKNFKSKDVQEQLIENGIDIGLIKDIKVIERTSSGRVKTLEITDRNEKSVKVPGKTFRSIIGPNILKSNMYDVVMQGYYFDLVGRGWGHGVGMCQWGAFGMAEERYDYKEILDYYYHGAELVKY